MMPLIYENTHGEHSKLSSFVRPRFLHHLWSPLRLNMQLPVQPRESDPLSPKSKKDYHDLVF